MSDVHVYRMTTLSTMIGFIVHISVLFQLINGHQRSFNFFMPDLPSPSSRPSFLLSSISTTHKFYPFKKNSFTKINLSGGPFNVKLNQSTDDSVTSVDIEADESTHKQLLIDIIQNDVLSIRMTDNSNLINKTNVTIIINYNQLSELYIDGMINIQCLNKIQAERFRLNNRANGFIKLKLDVDILDAYFHSVGRAKLCGQVNYEATLQSLGVGDIRCQNLLAKKINVISSGIGNIYVLATDEINITLSGIGTVYYAGPIKQKMKTGLGNIIQMQDFTSIEEK